MEKRLDLLLVEQGLAETRNKAREAILRGEIWVDGKKETRPGKRLDVGANLYLESGERYVSRAGYKLAGALAYFELIVKDKMVADLGSGTGGFVDCLLQKQAKLVYAVDVGKGQLHQRLREHPRVKVREGLDIRKLNREDLGDGVDFITADLSFISLEYSFPVISRITLLPAEALLLIKPQFELGPGVVSKRGIIKEEKLRKKAIDKIIKLAEKSGWKPQGVYTCPLRGKEGNQEYFIYITS